jgi:phage-related protein
MPRTELIIYKDKEDSVPLLKWMNSLSLEVQNKWTARFDLLEQFGFDLRRPFCDILRNGIYELRLKKGRINYRVLYTFVGKNVVLLSHGFSKKDIVPDTEIDKAIANRSKYLANPPIHTLRM